MTEQRTPGTQGYILVVDDAPANLRLISQMLVERGYQVRAVRSGARALAVAHAALPDLILLDVMMPEMDGYEVCRRLKEDPQACDVPVLFVSALDEVEDKVKGFRAGALDYITKPFQAEEVLARVQTHLELRRLQRELQTANDRLALQLSELRERNAELDAFAHTVAHDLKNPLTQIVGFADVCDIHYETLSDRERREYMREVGRSGYRMSCIIDELLLLAKMRQSEVICEPLDMGRVVQMAKERLMFLIEQTGAELRVPADWPPALGHVAWVAEIWANYLSNGCKYGGTPPVLELGACAETDTATGRPMVRFWVRDRGAGISEVDQLLLFREFTRLDETRAGGHGLGLSIVRRIAEKLGGRVGAESQVGQGSTFYFTLPAAEGGSTP